MEPLVNPLQNLPSYEDMKNFMERSNEKGICEEKYQAFLDLVGEYQNKKASIRNVLEEISALEHDLIEELHQLLPENERKRSTMEPNCKQHKTRELSCVFVGGILGLCMGVWAHLLF